MHYSIIHVTYNPDSGRRRRAQVGTKKKIDGPLSSPCPERDPVGRFLPTGPEKYKNGLTVDPISPGPVIV